jgi:glutaconate CoA-transferase, subunit B
MMIVAASRALHDRATCFVGIGKPSTAANLARATHAPDLVLIYESGTIGAAPDRLPLSIGDGVLADTATSVVSVPEIFNYWLQPGRIDVGFLGAAQLDRFANINTTVIGALRRPEGAPARCRRRPGDRRVVRRGGGRRRAVPALVRREGRLRHLGRLRVRAGRPGAVRAAGRGPTQVITDLGVLRPDPVTCELVLTAVHPGRRRRRRPRGHRAGTCASPTTWR